VAGYWVRGGELLTAPPTASRTSTALPAATSTPTPTPTATSGLASTRPAAAEAPRVRRARAPAPATGSKPPSDLRDPYGPGDDLKPDPFE
jgi:hypothetical protein